MARVHIYTHYSTGGGREGVTRKEVSGGGANGSAPPRREGGEPSRGSVHRDHRRRLRGGATVAGERAARHLGVGGQVRGGRHNHGRQGGGRMECGRLAGPDAARRSAAAEPPAENVLRALCRGATSGRHRLDGTHGRCDRRVPDVVIEAAAPLPPAEYAAQFSVHAPVAVREQYGRDDGVCGQRQERGQRARGRDATEAGRQRRPLGQLERRVRRPACGRRNDD